MTRVKWELPQNWPTDKKARAIALARRTGSLRHFLNPKQREVYDAFFKGDHKSIGVYCSRKNGKSWLGYLIGSEFCLKNPGVIARYICDTTKQAKEIVFDIYNQTRGIFPPEFIPEIKRGDAKFVFPNGSELILGGSARENIESCRGPRMDLLIGDEIASWDDGDDYHYALRSILLPQRTVSPHKRRLDLTTPPKNPAHVWMVEDYARYSDTGSLISWDIDENPLLDDADVEEILKEDYNNDRNNPDFLREHKLQLIPESKLAVIPECSTDEGMNRILIDADEWLELNDTQLYAYIVVDYGTVDDMAFTGFLYSPVENKCIAIEEMTIKNGSIVDFVDTYFKMVDRMRKYKPHPEIMTVIDCMEDTRKTLRDVYNLEFLRPFKRRHKVDSVQVLREKIVRGDFLVDKRLKRLRSEIKLGMWKETAGDIKEFARSDALGHLDHLDTAVYTVLYIPWGKVPGKNENERITFARRKRK